MELQDYINNVNQAAASITSIQEGMEAERTNLPALDELTTRDGRGKLNVWGRIQLAFAFLGFIQTENIKAYRANVQALVDSAYPGTARWWDRVLRTFQYGDNLEIDLATGRYFYPAIDSEKQIIKHVSLSAGIIKVAAEDGSNNRIALTTDQLAALNSYIGQVCMWGAQPKATSRSADLLRLTMKVHYNALFLLERVKEEVNRAIMAHIKNLSFNGTLYRSKLQDAVQAVEGVTDVQVLSLEARHLQIPYQPVERIYQPLAGYLQIDAAHPLQSSIEFIPS
jgi:hypothetical protein